jgi:choice-of-anchor B domain-containing protein
MTARHFLRAAFVLAIAFGLAGGLVQSTGAHDELNGRPHHIDAPMNPTAVMKAFMEGKLEDDLGVQNLEATAATGCSGGFADGYPCNNVDLAAFMPLADIGGDLSNSEANDIWGWTDPLDGKEYAIIGRVFGTSFVDISIPTEPVYLGELRTHGSFGSPWRDIKVYNNHAFIVSEARAHGMQVFDLTQLRNVANPPVLFQETAHYGGRGNSGFGSAHNIVINEDSGFAYAVGTNKCSGGLAMVDIRTPTNPKNAGCYSADGYTHDAQCVIYSGPDGDHYNPGGGIEGREICFASNEDTLTIVDVTIKNNPVLISRTGYDFSEYTHQGWLTKDQAYFLLDDELDEQNRAHDTRTRVFDVSDLDAPVLDGYFDGATTAIDHNQYVHGNCTFQANYRAGLAIHSFDPDAPGGLLSTVVEEGYFDVYPGSDAALFNGAWSNYPYFESGTVIVSGIEQGLFILQPSATVMTACGLDNTPNAAPNVSINSPDGIAPVSGSAVAIEINALDVEDAPGSLTVEWQVDGGAWMSVDSYNGVTGFYEANWDLTGVPDGGHSITARATDSGNKTTVSAPVNVTVSNGGGDPTIHIGSVSGSSTGFRGTWDAKATIVIHDNNEILVDGANVEGTWSNGATGSDTCVTDANGTCSIELIGITKKVGSVTFTVDDVTVGGFTYDSDDNDAGNSVVISK